MLKIKKNGVPPELKSEVPFGTKSRLPTILSGRRDKGFTLVEVMVVVGIFGLITAAIYGTLATAGRSWAIGEGLINVQQSPRLALDNMLKELRLASYANVVDNRTVIFSIPIDADGDGFLDLITGTITVIYGADDPQDYDTDGVFWEQDWKIKYQINTVDRQIIRQVLDDQDNVATQRTLVRDINPDPSLTFFQTQTGVLGTTEGPVIISLTTQVSTVQGRQINPPLQTTLTTRVNLRN